jgi:hypothetical protein
MTQDKGASEWRIHPKTCLLAERFGDLLGVLSARNLLRHDDVWGAVSGVISSLAIPHDAPETQPGDTR